MFNDSYDIYDIYKLKLFKFVYQYGKYENQNQKILFLTNDSFLVY